MTVKFFFFILFNARDHFFFGFFLSLPIKGHGNFDHSIRKIEHSAMAEKEREKRKEKPAQSPPDSEEESDADDASRQHKEAFQLAKDIMDDLDPTVPNMIAFNDGKTQFLLITYRTMAYYCPFVCVHWCNLLFCLDMFVELDGLLHELLACLCCMRDLCMRGSTVYARLTRACEAQLRMRGSTVHARLHQACEAQLCMRVSTMHARLNCACEAQQQKMTLEIFLQPF